MKRLILAVMAITLMAAPMANAQRGVSKDALTSRLAKADATIADAKQSEFPIETLCADNSIVNFRYKL